ncbi:hypothetical protein FB567DRAFT_610765 [Paraphoma chrysanthemicola]|uniref:Ankyrin repeat protein n=1 Tax=Paraphoma chrysanthemicola TaxID=798071 RepID=A0A8K0VTV0_9PLEO|nr:hypothetical protein FB567DRAFT_610765 [Paraphoma chrysanthemicola]
MDPVSVLSIASAAGNLAFKCGTIVQTLHCLIERYRQAELTILSVIQGCRTVELAWSRIERWAANNLDGLDDYEELGERLQMSIYAGQLFMAELEKDLASLKPTPRYSTLRRRTKILWNDALLREHQDRIHRQVCALTLLLEVMQLPSGPDRAEMLSIKEPVFQSVEESVRSIVPTRLSHCSGDAASVHSIESCELGYTPFEFENDLFTSYVYKRNFRVAQLPVHQVQRKPTIRHAKTLIEKSAAYSDDTAVNCNTNQDLDIETDLSSTANGSVTNSDYAEGIKHTQHLLSDEVTKEPSSIYFGMEDIFDNIQRDLSRVASVCTDSRNSVADSASQITIMSFDAGPAELQLARVVIGIEREPVPKPSKLAIDPVSTQCAVAPEYETSVVRQDWENSLIGPGIYTAASNQSVDLFSQLRQGDTGAAVVLARDQIWCKMLNHPVNNLVCPDVALMLECLYAHERSLFGVMMQVLGLMRGTGFMDDLADGFMKSNTRLLAIEDATSLSVQTCWAQSIRGDPTIAHAAAFRDLAASTGILECVPTALQLACVAKKEHVVEYLLSLGQPLVPLNWTVHPFILATKRRCRPILELFFERAKDSVSSLIQDLALAMVVNQDCALSEDWLDANQNDNKRVGADLSLITLLLNNGASPNTKDQDGVSVLSMAIKAAYSQNPFSLQIVDILLRRGARCDQQEQQLMAKGPPKVSELLVRHRRLIIQQKPEKPFWSNQSSQLPFSASTLSSR